MSRKRGFEDEDDDVAYEPAMPRGPAAKRSSYEDRGAEPHWKRQRRPRQSHEVEVMKNLSSSIAVLGDYNDKIPLELKTLSEEIVTEWGSEEFRTHFTQYIYAIIIEQPQKVFLVSALLQVADARNSKIAADTVAFIETKAQELLDGQNKNEDCGQLTRLKLIARFLATMIPIYDSVEPVIQFYKDMLELANVKRDNRHGASELVFVGFTLSIPYLLNAKNDDEIKSQCQDLVEVASNFEIKEDGLPQFPENPPYTAQNVAKLALAAVKPLDLSIFPNVGELVAPLIEEIKSGKDDDAPREEETLHHFLGLSVPKDLLEAPLLGVNDQLWESSRYPLQVFLNKDLELGPPIESYVSLLIRDVIQDIVQNMEFNRITVSRQLLMTWHYFNDKLFAKPNSSEDKLTIVHDMGTGVDLVHDLENNADIPDSMKETMLDSARRIDEEFKQGYTSTWKLENLIVEAILDLMFALPKSTLPGVYYQILLADTCGRDWTLVRRSPHSNEKVPFSKVVGEALKTLYQESESLDFDLRIRYVCWMLLQLDNFNFDWQWDEWAEEAKQLEDDPYNPKEYIIRNVIAKEVRISTPNQIRKSLPAEMSHYTNLALKDKQQLIEYDTAFFGEELSTTSAEENDSVLQEEIKAASTEKSTDSGNAEVYHLIEQYLFNNEAHPPHETCHAIYTNIQEGESLQSFNDLVVELKPKLEAVDVERYIVALVAQSVCIIGSRSLSVIEGGALELCGDKLRKVLGLPVDETIENDQFLNIDNYDERQDWVINSVIRLWNNEPRIGYLVLEKFRNRGLISSEHLLKSLFAEDLLTKEVYAVELLDRILFEEAKQEPRELFVKLALESIKATENKWNKSGFRSLLKSRVSQMGDPALDTLVLKAE